MVSESKRLALHRAARSALGEEEGDKLMEVSPPANTEIATRQDVERSEKRLDANIKVSVAEATLAMTKALHRSELRIMALIVAAFLGSNLRG